MIITDARVIIGYLRPLDVRTIPFREYSSKRKALVDAAREAFEKGEGRLEELLMAGKLDEKEKKPVFANMEKAIGELLHFNLEGDAYVFTIRYISVQQQYLIH